MISKFWKTVKTRPFHIYSSARCQLMFMFNKTILRVLKSKNIKYGNQVNIQRLSSLMAEQPHATVTIGDHVTIYEDAIVEAYNKGRIVIGACSIIGATKLFSRYSITIGERVLTSWNVYIQDYDPHPTNVELRKKQVQAMAGISSKLTKEEWDFPGADIIIGDDVWIGTNVCIMKGAKIGSGSVVAAGSVVLKGEYPDRSLIAGNPAKVLKSLG